MKPNLTTGGQYSGIFLSSFLPHSGEKVLLELSTKECCGFDTQIDTCRNDPQTISYLNLHNDCENSIYWYPYKMNEKQRRRYKKLHKRNLKENLSILEALEIDIWK